MTLELTYLALTAVLAASLWIPFIVGLGRVTPAEAVPGNFVRPPEPSSMPPWVHRAFRAHLNLIEQFVPFAALVVIAHLGGVSNGWTVGAVVAFFWLRVAHAVVMITAIGAYPARPIIFTAAWVAILVLGWQVLAA